MNTSFRQHLMRHLGALSLLTASGAVAPAVALADIPATVLDDAANDMAEDVDASDTDRLALLRLIASDARPQVRAGVADAVGRLSRADSAQVEELLMTLASDKSSEVGVAAAMALATHLRRLHPLSQMAITAGWATSADRGHRLALAQALGAQGRVFLADMALEVLSMDDDRRVRREAVQSIERRYLEAPEVYRPLLERLTGHADRRTRSIARRALGQLRSSGQLPPSTSDMS